MDPVSAAFQCVTSINNIINTLLSKASTPEIDALIQIHIDTRTKLNNLIEHMLVKVLHIDLTQPVSQGK